MGFKDRKREYPQAILYVPGDMQPTLKKLREILDREGKSVSAWFREQAVDYVREHEPGNPQKRLEPFTGEPTAVDPFGCGNLLSKNAKKVRCRLSSETTFEAYCIHSCKFGPRLDKFGVPPQTR
jgi:hypothetical protein